MNSREQGFLLLTGYLGNPDRRPLTTAQFRELALRARVMEKPVPGVDMVTEDLLKMGYSRESADRILLLLSQTEQLEWYLTEGKYAQCVPVTRISKNYPNVVHRRLLLDAPGVLWAKGDLSLLDTPMIALVGSRELNEENRIFAQEVGIQAARQGFTLVSGNAKGADRTAQDACLEQGGKAISVVADRLDQHKLQENILYLSEDGFDLPFSAQRALSRNRVIHCLGSSTFVAQCHLGRGGTWDGTTKNLRYGWSPVYCYGDGSPGILELSQMGAKVISCSDLQDIAVLKPDAQSFME